MLAVHALGTLLGLAPQDPTRLAADYAAAITEQQIAAAFAD